MSGLLFLTENIAVANNCEALSKDDSLNEFLFLDFLLGMLQTDRKKRQPAKQLLEHPFLVLPLKVKLLEAQTSGDFEPLSEFCLFTSAEHLKSHVEGLKSELKWKDDEVVMHFLNGRFGEDKFAFFRLIKEEAILAAASIVRDGQLDVKDEYIQESLNRALDKAAGKGQIEYVKLLCECGGDANGDKFLKILPLHSACLSGHFSIAEYLIEQQKVNVNAKDLDFDTTPLHNAASKGHSDIVRLLCESGAKINARCFWIGDTALHEASAHGHASAVDVLIKMGAKKSVKNENGETARAVAGSRVDRKNTERLREIRAYWEST